MENTGNHLTTAAAVALDKISDKTGSIWKLNNLVHTHFN